MLEFILVLAIAFAVLAVSSEFCAVVVSDVMRWRKCWREMSEWEEWEMWMQTALNPDRSIAHCGKSSGHPWLMLAGKQVNKKESRSITKERLELILHACRQYEGKWAWVDSHYYLANKLGESVLYEKVNGKRGQAWLLGIQSWSLLPVESASLATGQHALRCIFRWRNVKGNELVSEAVFRWQEEKK